MKKIILIISLLLVSGCSFNKINFQEFEEVKYLNDYKDNISSVIVHKTTLGSNDCYNIDIEKAFISINNIEIEKKSNISVTDDYLSYIFNFNDDTDITFSFEGKYLHYKDNNYKIDNFKIVDLNEENIVECNYSRVFQLQD